MIVDSCEKLNDAYALIKLTAAEPSTFPNEVLPGQFVQIEVPDSRSTYLRRPISVNFVEQDKGVLWLLVREAGPGTHRLVKSEKGDIYNVILPLGKNFNPPCDKVAKILLVGGGVGVAPLLYYGKCLKDAGYKVDFALGARSHSDLLEMEEFRKYGTLHISTDDGSFGEKGIVTTNSVFDNKIDYIACCGPTPMMKAVAKIARERGIECEVSLENMMACGLGACLCCVEDTTDGNVCVCTEGPVFNINKLKWDL